MKLFNSILLISILLSGCSIFPKNQTSGSIEKDLNKNNYTGEFVPVQPTRYDPAYYPVGTVPKECTEYTYHSNDTNNTSDKKRRHCWLSILANSEDYVATNEILKSGSVEFGTAKTSKSNSQYEIVSQWVRFINVSPIDATGVKRLGVDHKVGVGARIVANITTHKAGINLGDLFAVAASAEAGQVQGSLLFTIQGIHGKGIDTYTPRVSKLDQENLRKALEAIQSIKTLLHNDDAIYLTGQVVAIRETPSESKPTAITVAATFAKKDTKLKRQGWVYVGAFDSNGTPLGVTNLVVSGAGQIIGNLKVRTDLYVRDNYPQFPSFQLGEQLDVLKEGSDIEAIKTIATGINKVWAFIEY
ncbi:MAG: hypothetical protein HOP06_05820 [Methylotenera sp.]|nr:hypothetical protein [Methylotenera sp.]